MTEAITLDLEHELLFKLCIIAHREGMTLNQLINQALLDYLNEHAPNLAGWTQPQQKNLY